MSDTLVTHGQPMAQHGKPMRDAWVTHGYPMATHRMGNPWTSAITQRQSIGDRWVSNIYIYICIYILHGRSMLYANGRPMGDPRAG